jgi:hypothetical protein
MTVGRRLLSTDYALNSLPSFNFYGLLKMNSIATVGNCLLVLVFLTCNVWAQSGVDLDKSMLGGGGKRGPGAMLRFGCSQVSGLILPGCKY